ncbi:unnamed protein product [Ophioblennius macclurei]
MGIQFQVHGPRGEKKIVDVCQSEEQMQKMTVLLLKKKIIQILNISSDLRMVYRSETLEESEFLSFYHMKHMSSIQAVILLPGGH